MRKKVEKEGSKKDKKRGLSRRKTTGERDEGGNIVGISYGSGHKVKKIEVTKTRGKVLGWRNLNPLRNIALVSTLHP